jgi:cytochrome c5
MSRPCAGPIALVVFAVAFVSFAGHAQTPAKAPFVFSSVNTDLPTGDRMFPGGASADVVNNNCLACHSAGMVLNQPALSKAQWDAEVHKMINAYKAPVGAEDVPAIVAYLTTMKRAK